MPSSLFVSGVNILGGSFKLSVVTLCFFHRLGRLLAFFNCVHHLTQIDKLIADDLIVLVECKPGDIPLGHLQIPRPPCLGGKHGANLAAQALAQVLQSGADNQTVLRECGLRTPVSQLLEALAQRHIDGVAHLVGGQALQQGLAGQDLCGHSGGRGHTGAAHSLHQGLLYDTVLHIQAQLAGALLGCAPAGSVRETGDVADLVAVDP